MVTPQVKDVLAWAARWSAVYGANLIVPLFCGWEVTDWGRGRAGMLAAVWVLWAVGVVVGRRPGRLRGVLAGGGAVTALLQVFPILPIGAGVAATAAWSGVFGYLHNLPPATAEVWGFLVTVTTAQIVLVLAVLIGLAMTAGGTVEPS